MIKKLLNTKISKENKKGFTLAELLIVVAIIGVLVAISIPIFTTQLEKSEEATDFANIRSAYAEVVAAALTDPDTAHSATVTTKQTTAGWVTTNPEVAGVVLTASEAPAKGSVTIAYSTDGKVKIGSVEASTSAGVS